MFIDHLLCGKTINRSFQNMVDVWFYRTYALSFVECDMFVSIMATRMCKVDLSLIL